MSHVHLWTLGCNMLKCTVACEMFVIFSTRLVSEPWLSHRQTFAYWFNWLCCLDIYKICTVSWNMLHQNMPCLTLKVARRSFEAVTSKWWFGTWAPCFPGSVFVHGGNACRQDGCANPTPTYRCLCAACVKYVYLADILKHVCMCSIARNPGFCSPAYL